MVGIYGNWLVGVIDKIGADTSNQAFLFVASLFPLAFYFMEAFSDFDKQSWIGKASLIQITICIVHFWA